MGMDLRHLRYFVAVAEELHFARAAERIGIEQSPLSRAIKELEEDLGVRLFARTSRSTRITRAGEVFLDDARRILTEVRRARASVLAAAAGSHDRIRIGVSQSVAQPRLSRVLAAARAERPGIDISLVDLPVTQQARELLAGSIDIGFSPLVPDVEGVYAVAMWSAPLVAVLPVVHRLASARSVPLAGLRRESCLVCHPELHEACHALQTSGRAGTRTDEQFVAVASLVMLLEMVASSFAVGIALAGQLEVTQRSDIAVRPFEGPPLLVTTYALRSDAQLFDSSRHFLERAREIDQQSPGRGP
jgi:DNA-binding transcriptional LysR family regulator